MKTPFSIVHPPRELQFNMTAMIDIVFLLIVFFMLLCQFISQENYRVAVPDDCPQAQPVLDQQESMVTLSVYPRDNIATETVAHDDALFAVRARSFDPAGPSYQSQPGRLVQDLAESLRQAAAGQADPKVILRADRALTYGQVQHALRAVSEAGLYRLELAAFQGPQARLEPAATDTEAEQ